METIFFFKTTQIYQNHFYFLGNVNLVPCHKVKRRWVTPNRLTRHCLIVILNPQDQRFMIGGENRLDYMFFHFILFVL